MKKLLFTAGALTAFTLLGASETRSDIDPAAFPSTWDVKNRTTYTVDVVPTDFETLDSVEYSVLSHYINLNTLPYGFLINIR